MSRTLLACCLLFSFASAELLKPEAAKDRKEILTISGKRRVYYQVERQPLSYEVTGPMRLKIYSRTVSSQSSSKYQPFSFMVQIDDQEPITIEHKQRLTKSVKSEAHPHYHYSLSAVDYVAIPDGKHVVQINRDRFAPQTLIRVLDYDVQKQGTRKRLKPKKQADPVTILINDKRLTYYSLSTEEPLYVSLEGPATFELYTRLAFESWMGETQDYRIQVWDNGKLEGTFYFMGERSTVSRVKDQDDIVPGKWRSCQIPLDAGQHEIKIRVLDADRRLFIKMNRIQFDP